MYSTNALIMCIKMVWKESLKLACQTCWKPMEIEEKKLQGANAKPRKLIYLDRI